MGSSVSLARKKAYACLKRMDDSDAFAHAVIQRMIDASSLSQSDKAFAATLVLGVVRMQSTLDQVINASLHAPQKIKPSVRRVLRLGAFELLYLEKQSHAAVDQGVSLMGEVAPYAKGLANAVLRRVSDTSSELLIGLAQNNWEHICVREGMSQDLSTVLKQDFDESSYASFARLSNTAAPVYIHVNALQTTDAIVMQYLKQHAIDLCPEPIVAGCYKLSDARAIASDAVRHLIDQGHVIVSDLAAQRVALEVVTHASGDTFLEIGAGRGTKTALIQSLFMHLKRTTPSPYTCVESAASKKDLLEKKIEACGLSVSNIEIADASTPAAFAPQQTFSTVFLDAPCSGLGTLRRHPDIKNRITEDAITELSELQTSLLAAASEKVSPHGMLIYATCTVTSKENKCVVDAFLNSSEGKHFKLVNSFETELTEHGQDAHFCAIMQRVSPL